MTIEEALNLIAEETMYSITARKMTGSMKEYTEFKAKKPVGKIHPLFTPTHLHGLKTVFDSNGVKGYYSEYQIDLKIRKT